MQKTEAQFRDEMLRQYRCERTMYFFKKVVRAPGSNLKLSSREIAVLQWRNIEFRTLDKIAENLHVTPPRVRQIERIAIRKLMLYYSRTLWSID